MFKSGVDIFIWIKHNSQLQACRDYLRAREFSSSCNELHWRLRLSRVDIDALADIGLDLYREVEADMKQLDPLHEPRLLAHRFINIGCLHYSEGV